MTRPTAPCLLLRLLLTPVMALVLQASTAAVATSAATMTALYPEQALPQQSFPCGSTQLYQLYDLDPSKIYDLKLSYPASVPTIFTLQVVHALRPSSLREDTRAGNDQQDIIGDGVQHRDAQRRLLNTAKLRLLPRELAREWVPERNQEEEQARYALDRLTVVVSVRGDVEGVQPPLASLAMEEETRVPRECVYSIVVEEMLWGAFPRSTLVLIAWIVVLLAITARVVYPFLTAKLALQQAVDQEITRRTHGKSV